MKHQPDIQNARERKGSPRTEQLVAEARKKLTPNEQPPAGKLRQYAALLAATERFTQNRQTLANAHFLAAYEAAGAEYGIDGRADPEAVQRAQNHARKIMRQMGAKVIEAAHLLREATYLYEEHQAILPTTLKAAYPPALIDDWCRNLGTFAGALTPPAQCKLPKNVDTRGLPKAQYCFLLWLHFIKYRGRWIDMYHAARAWKLTDSKDPKSFEQMLNTLAKKYATCRISKLTAPPEDRALFD